MTRTVTIDLDNPGDVERVWQALERRRAVRDIDPELRLAITRWCERLAPDVAAPILADFDEMHPELVLEVHFETLTRGRRHGAGDDVTWRVSAVGSMLDELFASLRAYLHLEGVDHIVFALAVAIAAHIDAGDPLWGLIIGPPSSGKTEAVRMLDSVADEHPDEVTAPSLLSWSKGKEPKAVGILARLPNPGFLTVADFSTVLATSDRGGRDQLFALLRRAFDGGVSRDLGNAPRPLTWQGRLTLLAACTPIIDAYSSHADALGPRWLYCRVDAQDAETKRLTGRKALVAGQLVQHRSRAAELAEGIVRTAVRYAPETLEPTVEDALLDAAIVACYGRAAVERDGYGRREISSVAVVEEPPRITGQLALLARALLAMGMDAHQTVALCRRCALDSIPQARRHALAVLARFSDATVSDVARWAVCDRKVARMALEELGAIGVATCDDPEDAEAGARHPWTLAAPDDQLIRGVMLDHERDVEVRRKVGSTPPTPQIKGVPSHFSSQGPDLDEDDARDLSLDELDALMERVPAEELPPPDEEAWA